jgi:hypothetical protein
MEIHLFISPCKNIIFKKKNPLKKTKILQDVVTPELISSFNTSQNIFIFQKSVYKKIDLLLLLQVPTLPFGRLKSTNFVNILGYSIFFHSSMATLVDDDICYPCYPTLNRPKHTTVTLIFSCETYVRGGGPKKKKTKRKRNKTHKGWFRMRMTYFSRTFLWATNRKKITCKTET